VCAQGTLCVRMDFDLARYFRQNNRAGVHSTCLCVVPAKVAVAETRVDAFGNLLGESPMVR
jgi:hypothetical protein